MARKRGSRPEEQPLLVEADWSRGMVRDAPRGAIPQGGIYDSHDFLFHETALAMKRGGTSYAGPALTAANYTAAVVYAEFPAGAKLVGIGDNGHLYTVTAGTTTDVSTLGTGFPPLDRPKLRIGGGKNLLVIPASDGTTAPKAYTGAAVAALGGSPPAGRYVAIFKSRVVLASTAANPNRIFFSPIPDPETTWDTANAYWDASYPVTALASLQNALLIFSQGHLEALIGSTPPPGGDMDLRPIASTGCTDARSLTVQDGNAIFANPSGIYLTNGTTPVSLTEEGLIGSYWQGLLAGYDPATWVISADLFRSFLFVSILDNTGALKATLMCNVPKRAWWRIDNVRAAMMARAIGAQEELYYADRATNRVTALSGIFTPSAANKNDANGNNVNPALEMRLLGAGATLKHFGFGRLTYDMRDAGTDNPTLAVQVAPGFEATSYAAVPESPLAETSDATRARLTVAKRGQGVSFVFTQSGPSAKTELYALELEQRLFPSSHGGVS